MNNQYYIIGFFKAGPPMVYDDGYETEKEARKRVLKLLKFAVDNKLNMPLKVSIYMGAIEVDHVDVIRLNA